MVLCEIQNTNRIGTLVNGQKIDWACIWSQAKSLSPIYYWYTKECRALCIYWIGTNVLATLLDPL